MANFALSINKWVDKCEKRVDDQFSRVVTELFSDIVMATPVDTGNLQANWYSTTNSPSTQYDEDTTRGTDDVLFEILDAAKSKNQVAYLTNNAPYAYDIEFNGRSSGQGRAIPSAPQGMVRVNLAKMRAKLQAGL